VESVKQVEDQAAAWLVKRDSGEWTDADQQALDQWLESSTAHTVAFIRLETLWERTQQLKLLRARAGAEDERRSGRWTRFRRGPPWVIAASALCACVAMLGYFQASGASYHTAVGGIAAVPLIDGSKILLNTNSELKVDLTESERSVRLEQGEAYFNVAYDPRRPFIVSVGETRIVAVGTAFSVWRNEDDVRIAVTKGKVRFEKSDRSNVLLPPGSVVRSLRDQVTMQQRTVAEVDEALSWRTGFLTFHDTTLADAVAEFNRYSTRKIILEDPAIAVLRLSGKFQFSQSDAFVRLLERSFPVQAAWGADRIVLNPR
jgi:transmembrane sensor